MKYTSQIINYINLFEDLTRTKVKDCFLNDERIVFIINNGEISRAIGKNGSNVRRIRNLIKKNIKLVEFNDDVVKFVKNYIYPIEAKDVILVDSKISIKVNDIKSKALLMGRNSKNLLELKEVLNRYFIINGIKII